MHLLAETERLRIRPMRMDDSGFILQLVNSEGWLKFIGDRNIRNKEDADKYIQKIIASPSTFYCVFENKASGHKMGIITLLKRETQEYPDIGFALLPEFEKNGYTHEATNKYLEEFVKQSKYENILGITRPDNTNSVKLLMRLGLSLRENYFDDGKELSLYSMSLRKSG